MKRRSEVVAAVLNGSLVLIAPLALLAVSPHFIPDHTNGSTTVRPPGVGPGVPLLVLVQVASYLSPFALLAGWRTWVHARKWQEGVGTGWQGVVEAGATGLAVALILLAPGIVTRPLEAPPYVAFYGSAALILGLIVGLILRITAVTYLSSVRGRMA